jgi:hypothetical protein
VIYTEIWADAPIPCGRTGCPNRIQDQQQAVFIVIGRATMPFCSQHCFA